MTAARTDNPAASRTKTGENEMPKFGSAEMPASMHEMTEKGISQTKANFKNVQAATSEAGHVFQSAYTIAAKGATDYNLKVRAFQYQRRLRLRARIAGREDAIGVFGTVNCTRAPAIRDHDGADQGTRDFGAEGLSRDR
jgi:hypothetical protein